MTLHNFVPFKSSQFFQSSQVTKRIDSEIKDGRLIYEKRKLVAMTKLYIGLKLSKKYDEIYWPNKNKKLNAIIKWILEPGLCSYVIIYGVSQPT